MLEWFLSSKNEITMYKIVINNQISIKGSNLNQFDPFINANCIVENPDYASALKQKRWIKDMKRQYFFYEKWNNELKITRGLLKKLIEYLKYNNLQYEIVEDYLENEKIEINSTIEKLRPYQLELEQQLDVINGWYALVPTWGWKTVVMINEIAKNKQKTFLLIHNKKLLYQFIDRLKQFSDITDDDIWIYWDKKKEIKPITIWLMQSFWKLDEEEIQEITSKFDLFFIDEAHHLVAATLFKIWKNVKSRRFYWLTATPDKKNWMALNFLEKLTWELIVKISEEELEAQWIILRPRLIPIINFDSEVKDMYSDFFKFEDRIINKLYISDPDLDINNLLPSNENETTLLIWEWKNQIVNFYNNLPEKIKKETKILYCPIFKRWQKVLEKNKVVIAYDTPEQYRRIDMHKIKRKIYFKEKRSNLISNIIYKEFTSKNLNNDPNILVISDQIKHLEFMMNNLPNKLKKYATMLTWKQKKKEIELIEEKIKNKEIRIIFAIEKFVGEGWDVSHLDNLIMTYMLKDHELLKQLVWRVVRSSPNKKYAQVYDIIDINCPITYNQFKKRFFNYYQKKTNFNQSEINNIL